MDPQEERVENKSTFHLTASKWKLLLIINIIIGVLCVSLLYYGLISGGASCKSQPFIYGADYLSEKYGNANVFCECSIQSLEDQKTLFYEFTNRNYKELLQEPNINNYTRILS